MTCGVSSTPLRLAVAFELPPPEVSPEDARRTADEVLSGRAYVEAARGPSLHERVLEWIVDRVADVLGSLSSFGGRGLWAWAIIAVLSVAIVVLLSRLLRTAGHMPIHQVTREPRIGVTRDLSARQWRMAAEEAESAGDWRSGLRCRHRALVVELIEAEAVGSHPGQTAGEIERRVIAHAPAADGPMRAATWLFNNVWYGGREIGPAQRDEFEDLAGQVLTSLDDPSLDGPSLDDAPAAGVNQQMAVPS